MQVNADRPMLQRVLIVNKFFYNRGGDCVVAMSEEEMLRKHGHATALFTMEYPENTIPGIEYTLAGHRDFSGSTGDKIKATARALGYGDINTRFKEMLRKFKPDIVHFHNIHSYLSPRLVELAARHGARTLWTLHDYKLICPSYSFLRNGKICEECLSGPKSVLRNRCHKGSLPASIIAYLEALKWNRARLENATDRFICPSRFMRDKMIQGGFNPNKLSLLCNCIDDAKLEIFSNGITPDSQRDKNCVYIGRLSEEKGVRTLIEGFRQLPYRLDIYGDGPLSEELKILASGCDNIIFHGRKEAREIAEVLKKSYISIIPSECYENNPLGVIESECAGTPVAGSDMGGIPELIDRSNGIVFRHGETMNLCEAVKEAMSRNWDRNLIAREAQEKYNRDNYYSRLLKLMTK